MNKQIAACIVALALGFTAPFGETVTLEADRDATLIEDPAGALANGAGPVFFAGRTNQGRNSIRRALLFFNVATALPRGAVVERAVLTLHMTPSNARPALLTLHRVQQDWGEGTSAASGGGGAPAEPGDATWIRRFHPADPWARHGGSFAGAPSASTEAAGPGSYTWESRRLAADVRSWAAAERPNRGWILLGDEVRRQNVKSLASREHPDPALRPRLEITYRVPGPPR